MTRQEALYQSLATCCAVLITFCSLIHEYAGHIVFPWGPAAFGGPLGWHGLGVLGLVVGPLLIGATLRLLRFPVMPWAPVGVAIGLTLALYSAFVHHQFHLFAVTVAAASVGMGYCHRRANQLAAREASPDAD